LTYDNLSSSVTAANIRVTVATGQAPIAPATLCTTCVSGKFGRTLLTADQANAVINGNGSVVVNTTNNPDGEISGPIVKVTAPTAPAKAGAVPGAIK